MPVEKVESGKTGLVHRRKLRRGGQAALRRYGEAFDAGRPDLWHRVGRQPEQNVDVTGYQVLHRRPKPAVRDQSELRGGERLEMNGADVRGAADAGGAGGRLVGIGLQPANQL